ncbi:MAG: hypothetical protein MdMp014T_2450 [Treponematales bacterium]
MSIVRFFNHEHHRNFVNTFVWFVSFVVIISSPLIAQDFGFGDESEAGAGFGASGGSALAVDISGEVSASMTGFVDDFDEGADAVRLGDLFSGKLNFSAENTRAKGVMNLKVDMEKPPVSLRDVLDEAYLRTYFGRLDVEAGLRKLTWGKADNMGPLDVVNPLDLLDLSALANLSDLSAIKIARPLVHASLQLGQFSKLEGVFVPNFEPMPIAMSGRWVSDAIAEMNTADAAGLLVINPPPDTSTLDYFQAGLRFTTTINSAADIGFQYYYGRMTSPAVTQTPPTTLSPQSVVTFAYNPYHQIGVDYAQVLFGFNVRAEFAANITEDLDGNDGAVYNPSLAWSLGFDRDLFAGINLNVQCNETIRLLDSEVGDNPQLDIEADSDLTATRITAALSKKFLRDELELKAACLWEVESETCIVMPSLAWTKDDVSVELSGGIFVNDDNSFVKATVKYTF